jgi:7-keto-8-aminopelargonate synthetase-like enzyme
MLSLIAASRRCIFALVKFLSRLLTALNLLPSMATTASENLQLAAQNDELAAHVADRWAVILPEVGDLLEVRRESLGQPHQLDANGSLTESELSR